MDAILEVTIGLLRKRLEAHPRDVHLRTQSHGWTPCFCHPSGNVAMVKLLLEKGANPNICDENGKSPISQAVSIGDVGILKLLIERGGDLGARYKGLIPPPPPSAWGAWPPRACLDWGGR